MICFKLGDTSRFAVSIAALGLAVSLSSAPALAASPMTEAFLANVAANLAILDTSSRMAASHSRTVDVIEYADSETGEARVVATALAEAAPADHNRAVASADGALQTGRSVAVVGMPGRVEAESQPSVLEAANGRMPATADLSKLGVLHGRNFDKLYFVTQLDALSQIESDYRTYISQGDDPAIAKMAHEQLPVLMKRLEALTRI